MLGASGQVGWELRRTLAPLGEIVSVSRDGRYGPSVDLANHSDLRALLNREAPDLVVNAAAYTAVDKAESEPELALSINGEVPRVIGAWAADRAASVIHYSTDYVYDGSKREPYVETDSPNPLGVYGRTKLAGDDALLASGATAAILRVSWVYGQRGHNFLNTMRRLMGERDLLRVVDDQLGAPTWSRAVAEASAQVAARLLRADFEPAAKPDGVFHLSPTGVTSWYGFAQAIRERGRYTCALHPIPSTEYPTPARRPTNSQLNADKLAQILGIRLPDWTQLLALCTED